MLYTPYLQESLQFSSLSLTFKIRHCCPYTEERNRPFNTLTAVAALTSRDDHWLFFNFRCHQVWLKLASLILKFCRRKWSFQSYPDQKWLGRSTDPEICMKMLRNLSKKLGAKLPSTTLVYSTVRISHLDNASLETLELEESPEEVRRLRQKDKKKKRFLFFFSCYFNREYLVGFKWPSPKLT